MFKNVLFLLLTLCSPAMQKEKYSFLALGDSYTIGESVEENERWPNQMVSLLKVENINFTKPQIIATTGWTTSELQNGIQKANITETYDVVSLLIGVNNQYRGQSIDQYRKEFIQLLEQSINLASGKSSHVLVISIPDYGVTPFAKNSDTEKISREIDDYNKVNKEETLKLNAHYIEITEDSRLASSDLSLLASDQLHPSGKMYSLWAKKAAFIVKEILQKE